MKTMAAGPFSQERTVLTQQTRMRNVPKLVFYTLLFYPFD